MFPLFDFYTGRRRRRRRRRAKLSQLAFGQVYPTLVGVSAWDLILAKEMALQMEMEDGGALGFRYTLNACLPTANCSSWPKVAGYECVAVAVAEMLQSGHRRRIYAGKNKMPRKLLHRT